MKNRYKIDIAVGGRFHADRFAKALLKLSQNVRLLTSYPKNRFGLVPSEIVSSFLPPELAYRTLKKIGLERKGEQAKMGLFGSWVSRQITDSTDLAIIWSSFGKECFSRAGGPKRVVIRDSTHILHQSQLLQEEFARLGKTFEPDPVCIDRELAEYDRAERIIVLSDFARGTFVKRGISADKIDVLSLGVNTDLFRPLTREDVKLPLKAIYFGTLSIRKGTHILLEATKNFSKNALRVELVGPVEESFKSILRQYDHVTHHPAMPHEKLATFINQFDLYLFPTLEDGFPNTLIQSMAAGLVPITSLNNGPAELIADGEQGWHVSSGVNALSDAIERAIAHPKALLTMRERGLALSQTYTWDRYETAVTEWLENTMSGKVPSRPMASLRGRNLSAEGAV